MIWVWILLAVATTALLLKGKKIEPYNFVWALIPIDKYGITLFGFTFKPVYIFSMFLIGYSIIKRNFRIKISSRMLISTLFLGVLVVVTSLLRSNSSVSTDLRLYAMLFFTVFCSVGIMSMMSSPDDLRQIKDVIIATAVGYGILFLVLNGLDSIGISLPAVKSTTFRGDAIIRIYNNMNNGVLVQSQRLRGFYLDANISSVSFLVGFAALLGDVTKEGYSLKRLIFAGIIVWNVILTSSRTALIILLGIFIISVFRLFFGKVKSKQKIAFIGFLLVTMFCGTVFLIYNANILDLIYETLITRYFNRSGLTDDYGRFTIWRNVLSLIDENNWFCGIGTDGITQSGTRNDAHNTFIQAICANGIVFGIYYTLYFIYPLLSYLKYRLTEKKDSNIISTFAIVYLAILTISSTVSHICSVYMIYAAFLLIATPDLLKNYNSNTPDQLQLRG